MPAANNHKQHRRGRSMGQHAADIVAKKAGSWTFIFMFFVFMAIWIALNTYFILVGTWDPYPFILLNFVLSALAAIQAPIILMSQNRAAEIDRQRVKQDYYVDRRSEKEIKIIRRDVLSIKAMISKQPKTNEIEALTKEIKKIQKDLEPWAPNVTHK